MEANTTVNGIEDTEYHIHEKSVKFVDNNNEGENAGESLVTEAEVNHHSIEEPIVPKRSVFPETNEEKDSADDSADQPDGTCHSTSAPLETSENFIKLEERNVIERLGRVIDSELSIETLRVDTEDATEEVNVNDPKLESEESKPEPEEPVAHIQEANEELNRFQVNDVSHEKEEPLNEIEETLVTRHEIEVRHEENHFYESTEESNYRNEAQNDEIFETPNENHREGNNEPVVDDVMVKQNGRKIVYSSEEDVSEETDQMPEIIGFRSTLKKWSTGKPGITEDDEVPPVDPKDKFKTLRQIKRGNTRSLMEKFQSPAKS